MRRWTTPFLRRFILALVFFLLVAVWRMSRGAIMLRMRRAIFPLSKTHQRARRIDPATPKPRCVGFPLGPGIAFRPEGPLSVIAVVHRLKPCRWHTEVRRNILFHGGLPLLGAEDRAMDVAGGCAGSSPNTRSPAGPVPARRCSTVSRSALRCPCSSSPTPATPARQAHPATRRGSPPRSPELRAKKSSICTA